jgi:hypothetical protein
MPQGTKAPRIKHVFSYIGKAYEKVCLGAYNPPNLGDCRRKMSLELRNEVAVAQRLGDGQAATIEGVSFAHQFASQIPPSVPPAIQQREVVSPPELIPATSFHSTACNLHLRLSRRTSISGMKKKHR